MSNGYLLSVMVNIFSKMLNSSSDNEHSCLVLELSGNASTGSPLGKIITFCTFLNYLVLGVSLAYSMHSWVFLRK